MTNAPLRLGMIGAGRWSRAFLRTAHVMPDACRIVVVARRSRQSLEEPFAGIPVVDDWRELVAARAVDGLIIATPPALHAEPAIAAAQAGIPILLEKPMTLDAAEARAIHAAVREEKVPALVDHTPTFHPAYRAICAAMRSKSVCMESLSGAWGPFRADYGSLWDWGSHDVAMAVQLASESPCRIRARRLTEQAADAAVGQRFRVELWFPCGSSAALEFGNIMPVKTRRFLVSDGSHRLLYDDWTPPRLFEADPSYAVVLSPAAGATRPLPCSEEPPLTVALREFCERVRRGDDSPDSIILGQRVVEVLAEAERQVGPP